MGSWFLVFLVDLNVLLNFTVYRNLAQERQSPMQNITCCLIYSQSSGIGAIN
jgi:hypothetical protein